MRAIGRGVEHEIGELQTREVFRMRQVFRKDQPRGVDASLPGFAAEIPLRAARRQQPEDASRHAIEQATPDVENLGAWLALVGLIETAEHGFLPRQTGLSSSRGGRDDAAAPVRLVVMREKKRSAPSRRRRYLLACRMRR